MYSASLLLIRLHELIVHEPVGDAMDKDLGARLQCDFGGQQFGRVHGNSNAVFVSLVHGRPHDLRLLLKVFSWTMNEPDFDEIGFPIKLPAYEFAGVIRGCGLDNRRV